mmetsp:Transcript_19162/g.55681  ORF Transcript_19162/g.55681 Transcript_19162/m.55681 type:complete len:212 (-) Transcript_19162:916-1551(-)
MRRHAALGACCWHPQNRALFPSEEVLSSTVDVAAKPREGFFGVQSGEPTEFLETLHILLPYFSFECRQGLRPHKVPSPAASSILIVVELALLLVPRRRCEVVRGDPRNIYRGLLLQEIEKRLHIVRLRLRFQRAGELVHALQIWRRRAPADVRWAIGIRERTGVWVRILFIARSFWVHCGSFALSFPTAHDRGGGKWVEGGAGGHERWRHR